MNSRFQVVSLTYRTADLALREPLALDEAASRRLLGTLQQELHLTDVLVLSTCSRTEVYYRTASDCAAGILAALGRVMGQPLTLTQEAGFRWLEGEAATRHLFDVALGLDAPVLGDQQALGQVKRAYQWAADASTAGPWLHRLLHSIFFTHKRVQQETAFRDGTASASYAALELAESLTAHLPAPRLLLLGLGEIGTDVARHFGVSARFSHVTLCNRTRATAEVRAAEYGLRVLDLADLAQGLQEADVVISSVAAAQPCITRAALQQLTILSHKYFIDLSVPRSVETAVEDVPGGLLYTLDDLQSITSATLARRQAAVPQVRALIAESLAELGQWNRELAVTPTIQKLKDALEQLRVEEMQRFNKHLNPEEAQRMDELTRALMQKVLKQPARHLKAACQQGETGPLVELLTELFDLEPALTGC